MASSTHTLEKVGLQRLREGMITYACSDLLADGSAANGV